MFCVLATSADPRAKHDATYDREHQVPVIGLDVGTSGVKGIAID